MIYPMAWASAFQLPPSTRQMSPGGMAGLGTTLSPRRPHYPPATPSTQSAPFLGALPPVPCYSTCLNAGDVLRQLGVRSSRHDLRKSSGACCPACGCIVGDHPGNSSSSCNSSCAGSGSTTAAAPKLCAGVIPRTPGTARLTDSPKGRDGGGCHHLGGWRVCGSAPFGNHASESGAPYRRHHALASLTTLSAAMFPNNTLLGAIYGRTAALGHGHRHGRRRSYGSVTVRAFPGAGVGSGGGSSGGGGGSAGGKVRRSFVCSKCGARHGQYHGKCSKCGGFGTIDRDGVVEEPTPPGGGGRAGVVGGGGGGGAGVQTLERIQQDAAAFAANAAAAPTGPARAQAPLSYNDGGGGYTDGDVLGVGRAVGWVANSGSGGGGDNPLDDVPLSLRALSRMGAAGLSRQGRISLSGRTGAEVQRVLGGGVVPGALVMIGGDPGVGKSTITLQIAAMMAHPEIDFDALEDQLQSEGEEEKEGQEQEVEEGAEGEELSGHGNGQDSDEMLVQVERTAAEAGDGEGRGRATDRDASRAADVGIGGSYGVGAIGPLATEGRMDSREGTEPDATPQPSQPPRTVLYVTAEETREQIVDRSRRMGLDGCDRVAVLCRSEMSSICRAVLQLRPAALVMDSINTVYLSSLPQAPGTITQIRECGQLLLRLAKDHRLAVFIIGHVTKGGEMAGPNMLAHMVDTVLYMEGDVAQSIRLLRVVKNRHGSDSECGVFTMDGNGLHAVANHSALFLENRLAEAAGADGEPDSGASSVVGVTLQGSRAILVEVQALVSTLGDRAAASASASALSYRSATGVDKLRLANLCAILDKHVPTLELSSCSVIVNVVGGAQVRDVASDLALAVAIASSYYNTAVPRDLAVCGEVDLAGRVRRSFQRLDVRVREAAKLGFRKVVIPQTPGWERLTHDPHLRAAGVQLVAVRSVAEALRVSLGPGVAEHRPPHIKPPPRGKPPFGTGPPGSRFSKQRHAAVVEEVPPDMAAERLWPAAAALGGVQAAYAAAATAPPPPYYPPPPAVPIGSGWVATPPGFEKDAGLDEGAFLDGGDLDGSVTTATGHVEGDDAGAWAAGYSSVGDEAQYIMPGGQGCVGGVAGGPLDSEDVGAVEAWPASAAGWVDDAAESAIPLQSTDALAANGQWAEEPGRGGSTDRGDQGAGENGGRWSSGNAGVDEAQAEPSLRAASRRTGGRRTRRDASPKGS